MNKPLIIDFFCCQGGASKGYSDADFEVIGSDFVVQPLYPFRFVKGNVVDVFEKMVKKYRPAAVAGSPPCQPHTNAQRIQNNIHADFLPAFRELCIASDLPYIIENVVGAPMIDPVMLCGSMFPGLRTYRHRLFESNVALVVPEHRMHIHSQVKMGRPLVEGDWYQAVGNFSNVPYVRENMGVPWMTRDGIRECLPPVYTEYLGRQLMEAIA